jgi:hypothetical protein
MCLVTGTYIYSEMLEIKVCNMDYNLVKHKIARAEADANNELQGQGASGQKSSIDRLGTPVEGAYKKSSIDSYISLVGSTHRRGSEAEITRF